MAEELIEVTESRKKDHIELAFKSQLDNTDHRFYYEPLLSGHPENNLKDIPFIGKKLKAPIWISSMTGGTGKAKTINENLGRACGEYGLGMGLGSCRIILEDDTFFEDFNLRPTIGNNYPFFANLGVAQLETLITNKRISQVQKLVDKLKADGIIIHVNPLQEWLQPEGDHFTMTSLQVVEEILNVVDCPVIVKEVGQGMGYHSLKALFQLPLAAIDFAAHGGTNFAMLELLRADEISRELYTPLAHIGHTAEEMVGFTNQIVDELGDDRRCNFVIISGGIKTFLDGYYLINKIKVPAIYGMASPFLKHAMGEYAPLKSFVELQLEGLKIANAMLRVR
jgi:isopentenyl-diphosphate delta-isomerase